MTTTTKTPPLPTGQTMSSTYDSRNQSFTSNQTLHASFDWYVKHVRSMNINHSYSMCF